MVTFTALAKIYSTEYFCNTKVAGLGEVFVQRNFLLYDMYMYINPLPLGRVCVGGGGGGKGRRGYV